MEKFTEAYDKLKSSVKTYTFDAAWHKFLMNTVHVKLLVASNTGPNVICAEGLDKLRKKMSEVTGKTEGEIVLKIAGINPAGTQVLTTQQAEAAASVKLLRHFYLQKKQGAQSVWIFAQPKSYSKWVFDEIKNKTATAAKDRLDKIDEVYSKTVRGHMGHGVNQAKAWCEKCVVKLSNPDAATKAMVQRWFFASAPSTANLTKGMNTLKNGFRNVAALLRSNKVIFSDEPIDRKGGGWKDYAFVVTTERMDVVYIQKATLDAWSNGSQSWMATLAVVHELTHRVLGTDDAVYDIAMSGGTNVGGLKPGGILTVKHAIVNADSWAYFCADLNGCLSQARRSKVYKTPTAWDSDYTPGSTANF